MEDKCDIREEWNEGPLKSRVTHDRDAAECEVTDLRTRLSDSTINEIRLVERALKAEAALREAQERHAKSDACREENWKMVLAERSKRKEVEKAAINLLAILLDPRSGVIVPDADEFKRRLLALRALLPTPEKKSQEGA